MDTKLDRIALAYAREVLSNIKLYTQREIKSRRGTERVQWPPAAVAVCAKSKKIGKGYSHAPFPKSANPVICKWITNSLGSFNVICKNAIGHCAEQHAVQNLKGLNVSDISLVRFSRAYRPRTGQILPYCENCKYLFGL